MSRIGNNNTPFGVKDDYLEGNQGIYQICEFLGEGTYGKVAKCRKLWSQKLYAVKIMKSDRAGLREMETMTLIKHLDPDQNHLVRMHECFSFKNMTCIVYEILAESLHNYLCKNPNLIHLCHIRVIAQNLLKALRAIGDLGLAHCDIKLDNIMFREPNCANVKLIDFGVALKAEELATMVKIQVTPFRAPEVILGLYPLDKSVDMWALGVVLACIYYGQYPFPYHTEYDTIRAMVQIFGLPEPKVLCMAMHTRTFFIWDDVCGLRLQTPEEHERTTGNRINGVNRVRGFDEVIEAHQRMFGLHDVNDHIVFTDLLKRMLEMNVA
ncbi:Homeodomain-interacting protein kinase 1 [Oryzias melastigma]|uniref:Homeodomain-interacting protein kinase 1 n=1 Tax=Oryzias melastigma TaxID=30732 RepID=A0A834F924_ORYME|nr:Homeodomain-interacting protein kinase 1 [Oryzias melastigma]